MTLRLTVRLALALLAPVWLPDKPKHFPCETGAGRPRQSRFVAAPPMIDMFHGVCTTVAEAGIATKLAI